MKKIFIGIALLAALSTAYADQSTGCNGDPQNCAGANQNQGDLSNNSGAQNSTSQSSSSNNTNSSNSNASGNTISPTSNNNSQTQQSNQITNSGGNSQGGNNSGNAASTVGNTSSGSNSGSRSNSTNSAALVGGSTSVNTGGNTYRANTVFIPPVAPTPPSVLGVGNVISHTSTCGPLQDVQRRDVKGIVAGFTSNDDVSQGHDDYLEEHRDPQGKLVQYHRRDNEDGSYTLFGHQVTETTALIGVASAKSISIGGGSVAGGWGQAGGGVSGSNQQLVTTIRLRYCEVGTYFPKPQVVTPPAPAPLITTAPSSVKRLFKPKKKVVNCK